MELIKIYYTGNKEETLTGVAGVNGTAAGWELFMFSGETLFIPHSCYRKLKRTKMTDEDILNGNNKQLAEWYAGFKEKFDKMEAEKEAAAQKEEGVIEPVAVEGQDVEE